MPDANRKLSGRWGDVFVWRMMRLILIICLLAASLMSGYNVITLTQFRLLGENSEIEMAFTMPFTYIKNEGTSSLKNINNNINESFPLELIKGEHPLNSSALKNSTLVVVWGDIRSSEQAWETLYRQVLDVHEADLALIVQRRSQQSSMPSLYSRAKYVWEYHDFGMRWDQAIDLIGSSNDNFSNWRDFAKGTGIALGGSIVMPKGSGAIIYMLRWFAMNCLEPLLPHYERFVFTRIDHLYFCADPPLADLQKGFIWVPTGCDWSGLSDRHVVCDRDDVMKVLNVLPPIVRHPESNLQKYMRLFPSIHNTETLLKFSFEREGIWDRVRRYPRNMAITAISTDTTRWKKAVLRGQGPARGLLMKYQYEYDIVRETCKM